MRILIKNSLIFFLLCNASSAFGIFCTTSKKKLKQVPERLLKNFSYESGDAQTKGPDFGLSRLQLAAEINRIKNCSNKIADIGLTSCLEEDLLPVMEMKLKRMRTKGLFKTNYLGFEVSDQRYFRKTPKKAIKLPKELQDGLPSNWREIVAKKDNWTGIQYRSRTVGNPPGPNNSYDRVLIQVDEDPYEKWIQFTIPQPCVPGDKYSTGGYYQNLICDANGKMRNVGDATIEASTVIENLPLYEKKERLIDYISIDKDKEPNRIYFSQYWRDKNGRNPKRRDKAHNGGGFDTCYTCHPNGIRQLSPVPGSVSADDLDSFKNLKDKISGYNNLDWGEAINPKAYGPHLGVEQNCTSCHNNKETGRGAINYMTESSHITHKLVSDFSMNPVYRTKEKEFLETMQDLSRYITEKDRQEILKIIGYGELEGESQVYDVVLDYIERNDLQVAFDPKEYRATLNRIRSRNSKFNYINLKADIGTKFKEKLFGRCGELISPMSPANVSENQQNNSISGPEIPEVNQEQGESFEQ